MNISEHNVKNPTPGANPRCIVSFLGHIIDDKDGSCHARTLSGLGILGIQGLDQKNQQTLVSLDFVSKDFKYILTMKKNGFTMMAEKSSCDNFQDTQLWVLHPGPDEGDEIHRMFRSVIRWSAWVLIRILVDPGGSWWMGLGPAESVDRLDTVENIQSILKQSFSADFLTVN